MESGGDLLGLRIVGGDLALVFVNTRSGPPSGPPDEDALHRYRDVVTWARRRGVITDAEADALRVQADLTPDGAQEAYRHALRLRELLKALFLRAANGEDPSEEQLARLRDEAARALAHARILPEDGGYRWSWSGGQDLDRPLWPIAHAAAELVTGGPLPRLKQCAGCSFLFLDESKNRSRRWCSMDDCGTAAKVRRYVARRAATRTTSR